MAMRMNKSGGGGGLFLCSDLEIIDSSVPWLPGHPAEKTGSPSSHRFQDGCYPGLNISLGFEEMQILKTTWKTSHMTTWKQYIEPIMVLRLPLLLLNH